MEHAILAPKNYYYYFLTMEPLLLRASQFIDVLRGYSWINPLPLLLHDDIPNNDFDQTKIPVPSY